MQNVGLTVEEGVSNGLSPFTEASKHNLGILWARERGVPNKVSKVTSLQEDRKIFGGNNTTMFGPFVARNLFNNVLNFGAIVYGCRVVGAGSASSTGTLTDGNPVSQSLAITNTQAAGAGTPPIRRLTPSSVSVGDEFRVTAGATTISFTATQPTTANVTAGLATALNAELTANPTGDFGSGGQRVTSIVDNGTYIQVTGTNNVAFTFTVSTVNGNANDILTVTAGQLGQEDPGEWGDGISVKFYPKDHANGAVGAYLMEVFLNGVLQESITASTWELLVEAATQKSYYVKLELISGTPDISDIQTVTLSGGAYNAPIESDLDFTVFDGFDVQLLCNTEFQTTTIAQDLAQYCEARQDCMGVQVLPYGADDTVVQTFASSLQVNDPSFLAGYNIWAKTSDGSGGSIWVPAYGQVLGAGFIRVPMKNRDYIWTPPAGIDSSFRDCYDISPNPLSQTTINSWVQRYNTNVAVFRRGKGFFLFSSRTYSSNSLFHSIHIRRMTNFLVKTLEDNLLFAIQRPINPTLRREIFVSLSAYFRNIYNDGGLERTIPFEEACKVVCDKTNNPPTQDRKLLNVDVDWIPVECSESVRIRLNRNDGALIVEVVGANS